MNHCWLIMNGIQNIHISLTLTIISSGISIWVCLKIGYIPNYSHLMGIMISKTIGFRGTLFSDTPILIHLDGQIQGRSLLPPRRWCHGREASAIERFAGHKSRPPPSAKEVDGKRLEAHIYIMLLEGVCLCVYIYSIYIYIQLDHNKHSMMMYDVRCLVPNY